MGQAQRKSIADTISILQLVAAVISIAVKNDGDRGYTSFVLLILELNLVVWVGYYSDRNAGNAVKELEVGSPCYLMFSFA